MSTAGSVAAPHETPAGYCGLPNSARFHSSNSNNSGAPPLTGKRTCGARNVLTQLGMALEVFVAHLRGQTPVPNQHHPFEPEVLAQLGHLVGNGVGCSVARIGLPCKRLGIDRVCCRGCS